jgi:hypothetical protein
LQKCSIYVIIFKNYQFFLERKLTLNLLGDKNILTNGEHQFTLGNDNKLNGSSNTVIGSYNTSESEHNCIFGHNNTSKALGGLSVAIGTLNKMHQNYGIALGRANIVGNPDNIIASVEHGVAIGSENKLYSPFSTAIGHRNTAMEGSSYSLLINADNTASGEKSLVGGSSSEVNSDYSIAFGYNIINNALASAAFGAWNEGKTDTAFEVGYGTSWERKNVFEVTQTGIARAYGQPVEENDLVR